MAKTRPPYTPEFRRQMVELVRAGRSPEDTWLRLRRAEGCRRFATQQELARGTNLRLIPAQKLRRCQHSPGISRAVLLAYILYSGKVLLKSFSSIRILSN